MSLIGGSPDGRGQSETLGFALIIGLTLVVATAVVALGATALDGTQQQAELDRAENAMTQFDSRAAEVALSDTDVQSVDFGQLDGSYEVRDTAGTITITHVDCGSTSDGNVVDNGDNDGDQELYSGTLGALIYQNGDAAVAYQGGGVWRVGESGNVSLVSPPEFHYRDGTLTLPTVRTTGSGGAGGTVVANIRRSSTPFEKFYPITDSSLSKYDYDDNDCSSQNRLNPLDEGYVAIKIDSRYAAGWAQYFSARTDGDVDYIDGGTPDDLSDDSVTLELRTLGPQGAFPMPSDQGNGGGSVTVRGLDTEGHKLQSFQYSINDDDTSSSEFKNLQWSMYAKSGSKYLELSFPSGTVDCGDPARMWIYYSPDNHASSHAWAVDYTVQCSGPDADGDIEAKITVDLTGSKTATYRDQTLGPSKLQKYGSGQANTANPVSNLEFTQHQSASENPDQGSSLTYTDGSPEEVEHVIQHYFAEMGPNFELHVQDQQTGQAGVKEDDSGGQITYSGGGSVITFLHVSENRIEVRLN